MTTTRQAYPSGGSVELHTETAELWVELPARQVYDIIADSAPDVASLRRIAPEHRPSGECSTHVVTYLLRLELPA
jgi:hypothetical protein